MRKLLFSLGFICSVLPIFTYSQNYSNPFSNVFPIVNGTVTYTEVIQEEGKKAPELYKNAKIWLAETFRSAKDVIQNDDKDNHIVIGKGFISSNGHNTNISKAKYWFTIRIDCRDGRYKYLITDFIYEFDVNVMGTTSHHEKDFTTWGNVPFDAKYIELLDKKFPPNKERNSKQQEKYEQYKAELDAELKVKYDVTIKRYSIVDKQIKIFIESLKKKMSESDNDDW